MNKAPDCAKFVSYRVDKGYVPDAKYWMYEKGKKVTNLDGIKADENHIYKVVDYNKFEDNKTKIPPGARKVELSQDFIQEYFCGSKISAVEDKNILQKYSKDRHYLTHDNGGRPFCVFINKNYVDVYKIPENVHMTDSDYKKLSKYYYTEKVFHCVPIKTYVGKSSGGPACDHSIKDAKLFVGNSILVKISEYDYVYIGTEIFRFKAKNDEIIAYYSPIGNSDVAYPVAVGKNFVYFMLDNVRVAKSLFPKNYKFEEAYDLFYDKYHKVRNKDVQKYQTKTLVKRLY